MNRLKLISTIPVGYKESPKGRFLCKCGKEIEARKCDVNSGHTKSCGCLKRELLSKRRKITV